MVRFFLPASKKLQAGDAMNAVATKQYYLIQINLPATASNAVRGMPRADIESVETLLGDTGIELDQQYGPICINPQQQKFVVRGEATPEARHRVEERLGDQVRFFADPRVHPTSR